MKKTLFFLVIIGLSLSVEADNIYLKGGDKIEGTIVSETEEDVTIRSTVGEGVAEVSYPRNLISRIKFDKIERLGDGTPKGIEIRPVTINMGTSTKGIMPLLETIKSEHGIYFERIYGHYRDGYILISMNSNGQINEVETMRGIAEDVVMKIVEKYPRSEGRVELYPYRPRIDVWDRVEVKFDNGKITAKKIQPSLKEMELKSQRIEADQKKGSKKRTNIKLVCDLYDGKINSIGVGDFKEKNEIVAIIGKEPQAMGFGDYAYHDLGFNIMLVDVGGKSRVYAMGVYHQEHTNIFNERFNRFTGEINPRLAERETMDTIKEKFGKPYRAGSDAWGMIQFDYKRKFGKISFCFENNTLVLIDIQSSLD